MLAERTSQLKSQVELKQLGLSELFGIKREKRILKITITASTSTQQYYAYQRQETNIIINLWVSLNLNKKLSKAIERAKHKKVKKKFSNSPIFPAFDFRDDKYRSR